MVFKKGHKPWNKNKIGGYSQSYIDKQRRDKLGNKNPNWKRGYWETSDKYVLVKCPNHPFCSSRGYVMQHRLIMEKYIKRFLDPKEVVHHINGKTNDNRIENLELLKNIGEHNIIHHKGIKKK